MPDLSIANLQSLGLVETRGRQKFVRLGIKWKKDLGDLTSFAEIASATETWRAELGPVLDGAGVRIVPGSFTVLGQSVQAVVPAGKITEVQRQLATRESEFFIDRVTDLGG